MNIDEAYPANWFKAEHLKETALRLTMKTVEMAKMPDNTMKPVLSFADDTRKMALNKTNAKRIKSYYGARTERWQGKEIILYATETEMGGEVVDCIRVKIPDEDGKPARPTAKPKPEVTTDDPRTAMKDEDHAKQQWDEEEGDKIPF